MAQVKPDIFDSKSEAIATIFEHLDKRICARCGKRIFQECATVPGAQDT